VLTGVYFLTPFFLKDCGNPYKVDDSAKQQGIGGGFLWGPSYSVEGRVDLSTTLRELVNSVKKKIPPGRLRGIFATWWITGLYKTLS